MYEELYHLLFNAITDALVKLEKGETIQAIVCLTDAQRNAEERYLQGE